MTNEKFTLTQLNGRFIVTNRQSSRLDAYTDQGKPADITKPAEVRWFGMTLDEAKALKDRLNA